MLSLALRRMVYVEIVEYFKLSSNDMLNRRRGELEYCKYIILH